MCPGTITNLGISLADYYVILMYTPVCELVSKKIIYNCSMLGLLVSQILYFSKILDLARIFLESWTTFRKSALQLANRHKNKDDIMENQYKMPSLCSHNLNTITIILVKAITGVGLSSFSSRSLCIALFAIPGNPLKEKFHRNTGVCADNTLLC